MNPSFVRRVRMALCWLLAIFLFQMTEAATLLVSNANDNGPGSLRQAILDNASLGGSNRIVFSSSVTGTIVLTSGELVISNMTLTIAGPGANLLAVSGNSSSRVLIILPHSTVSISGLSIVNGYVYLGDAGGIANVASTLTLSNCVVSGNTCYDGIGGGVFNLGQNSAANLTLFNCILSNNVCMDSPEPYGGGAICNEGGSLTAFNCLIAGNDAFPFGGGILTDDYHHGVNLTDCTISGNQAGTEGGGIYVSETGELALTNCTVAQNTAGNSGGGVLVNNMEGEYGSAAIYGCTIAGNTVTNAFSTVMIGGGVYSLGAVSMRDSIVAGNSAVFEPDCYGNFDSGYNLIGNTNGGSGFQTSYGDLINVNPLLGPLQNNGGSTPTMAPLPASPAIDQGENVGLATDQRGYPRPVDNPNVANASSGDGSDIGAVEVQPGNLVVLNTNDSGAGSLRQMILGASADAAALGYDVISFAPQVSGAIVLTNGELLINAGLSIVGPGADVLAISGNNTTRAFEIANSIVSVSGLTIRDGQVVGATGKPGGSVFGGGICCDALAALTLTDCVISNCAAIGGGGTSSVGNGGDGGSAYGGGIFNEGGLTLDQCWVVGNQAAGGHAGHGGVVAGFGGNGGTGEGGGVYSSSPANVVIRSSTLNGNLAIFGQRGAGGSGNGTSGTAFGAGLFSYSCASISMVNSTVASNVVNGAGTGGYGGIYSSCGGIELLSCTIAGNNGDSNGGGIADLVGGGVTNTIIAGNTAVSAPDVYGTFTSGGYNLIGNTSGSSGFGATGDQPNVNPLLGPLQDNGGPTPTMALLSDSPAIDQGKSFGLMTDQRGKPRPFDWPSTGNAGGGDGSDAGAFELERPLLSIQSIAGDVVLSWPDYFGNFSVQSSTNLALSGGWVTAGGSIAIVGNQCLQTNSPVSGNVFFRLVGN